MYNLLPGEASEGSDANTGFSDSDVRVSKILIHPIKSCRGSSVQSARYSVDGLEHDRKWCIIEADTNKIITARDIGKTVLIVPRIEVDDSSPHGGRLEVSFPKGFDCETFWVPLRPDDGTLKTWKRLENLTLFKTHEIDGYICQSVPPNSESPSLTLSKYLGKPVHLMYKGPRPRACQPTDAYSELKATVSYQDGYPLLVLSEESVKEVEKQTKSFVGVQGVEEHWKDEPLVIERFRPNIILKGGGPFAEDKWAEMVIESEGEKPPGITLVASCARCLLPNVHTETGVRDRAVPYKVLMRFRTGIDPMNKMKPCLGRHGVPSGWGVMSVNNRVSVRRLAMDIQMSS